MEAELRKNRPRHHLQPRNRRHHRQEELAVAQMLSHRQA